MIRLQQDDERAFRAIYERYWPRLFGYAFNRLRDRALSQDVVQDVFLTIWRRRKELQMDNLSAYLHAAVRFVTYRKLAKMPLRSAYYESFENTLISSFFADETLLRSELDELLDKWIRALPTKRRKIFLMHFYDNLSTEEIAGQLGVTRKTVQNQLATAYSDIQKKYAHLLSTALFLSMF